MNRGPRDMTAADKRRLRDDDYDEPSLVVRVPAPPEREPGDEPVPEPSDRLLDGEIRPSDAWERANSAQQAAAFGEERELLTRLLRRERSAMPLPQQLAAVMAELLTLQSQRALELRPQPTPVKRKGTEQEERAGARLAHRPSSAAIGPERDHTPRGDDHGDVAYAEPHDIERRLRVIALEIEAIWELIDAHRGLSTKSWVLMSKEEKDALLVGDKLRGMTPEEINAWHPELGSPRTIRRIRNEAGLTSRGLPRQARRAA